MDSRKQELMGRLAVVTGAAGSTGFAIAKALVEDGLRVLLVDIDAERLERLCNQLGEAAIPVPLDVSDPDRVAVVSAAIRADHGEVDILSNNAGILSNNKAAETTPAVWLPGMKARGWGRIVNMCSLAMKTGGLTAGTAYTASKGGMAALTLSLARESAAHGVTVNAIAPAYIKTPMITEQLSEAQREQLLLQIPVGRFCEPEEVAFLVCYLISPLAGFVTGEIVDINGGLHLD
jgi:3-oxoacyl-[acyl-carrier protein] reductase